jgi:Domain of Unknown Function (DUF1206)
MTTTGLSSSSPQQVARAWRDPLGRAGLLAKGVLYLILGVLAIQFARGDTTSDQVSQESAIATLAERPFGKFLLVLLTIGLAAMCLWRAIQAFVGDPVEGDDGKHRIEYAVKAVLYGALVVTSAKITIDNWSSGGTTTQTGGGDEQTQQVSSTLFEWPAGRWLVGLLGVVMIAIAVYELWHQVIEATFMERIAPPGEVSKGLETFGRIGYAAKSLVLSISGIFFVVAAVQYDPSESKGLSGSLQELAEEDWGRVLLWGTAIGLFLYGVFCLAESRYRRHT